MHTHTRTRTRTRRGVLAIPHRKYVSIHARYQDPCLNFYFTPSWWPSFIVNGLLVSAFNRRFELDPLSGDINEKFTGNAAVVIFALNVMSAARYRKESSPVHSVAVSFVLFSLFRSLVFNGRILCEHRM